MQELAVLRRLAFLPGIRLGDFGPTDYTSIIGIKGHGKTTLSRLIQRAYPRVVIIDPMKEYRKVLAPAPNVAWAHTHAELERGLAASHGFETFTLIYEPNIWIDDLVGDVDQALIKIYCRGSVLLVIEEFWMFCSPQHMPKGMRTICFGGRHQMLAVVITAQRPAAVNKNFVSQCEHKFWGWIEEPNDLKYISELVGPDELAKLPTLQQGFFLWKRRRQPTEIVENR